jgi:hypothetical protein
MKALFTDPAEEKSWQPWTLKAVSGGLEHVLNRMNRPNRAFRGKKMHVYVCMEEDNEKNHT